jgi:hypothetical protein
MSTDGVAIEVAWCRRSEKTGHSRGGGPSVIVGGAAAARGAAGDSRAARGAAGVSVTTRGTARDT